LCPASVYGGYDVAFGNNDCSVLTSLFGSLGGRWAQTGEFKAFSSGSNPFGVLRSRMLNFFF
jgi:hypothetical protein